jgi:hypothetical protein
MSQKEIEFVLATLEAAKNVLAWYQDTYPDSFDEGDVEVNGQIKTSINFLKESLAKQEQGDPVAHRLLRKTMAGDWKHDERYWVDGAPSKELVVNVVAQEGLWRIECAYTTPQKQKPMTDDEFTTAIEVAGIPVEDVELVWAIKDLVEAHHDIKAVA